MTRSSIVTLTMNPALDVTADADNVIPIEKIRCRAERYDPGGGGINVARFAHALGASVSAVFTAGGSTGTRVADLVDASGVPNTTIAVGGSTRESFTVNDLGTGTQYRFVLPGPVLSVTEQSRCLDTLRDAAASAQFVVASGSLPPGVSSDFYQRVADICGEAGALLILDASGAGLDAVTSGVYLVKPSLRELREWAGRPLQTESDQLAAAHQLIDEGLSRMVVVSLGARGAMAVTSCENLWLPAISVRAVSGVGAGDAMVAGITVALSREWPLGAAVRYGICAAAAKLQTPGTSVFARAAVDRYFENIEQPLSVDESYLR